MTWLLTFFVRQSNRKRFILLLGLVTLCYAILMPDRHLIWHNFMVLMRHQTYLLHDFFEVAGLSATFLNVALHFFVAYFLMGRNDKTKINGLQIGAIGIFVGHAFFGTHLLNSLPIILGVVLYARWTSQSFKFYTSVSLFSVATGPVVSFVMHEMGNNLTALVVGLLTGISLGFIATPLAEQFLKFHNGFSLYNFGFTTGMISMFAALVFPYFGWQIPHQILLSQDYTAYLLTYFGIIWLLLCAVVVKFWQQAWSSYPDLIRSSGRVPDDFASKFGLYPTILNMCLNSGLFLLILLLLGTKVVNGPILGGLLSVMGFSAFGKHVANCLPVAIGIAVATLLIGDSWQDIRFQLALLFGLGLAPISGYYGFFYGLIAGFLHYNLTSVTFHMHQGLGLYNNGFTTGFVAAFMVPIIDTFKDYKPQWKSRHRNK